MTTYPFDTDRLVAICRKNDVAMVGVFGSMARGEATAHNDIDLLVKFGKRKSLLALVRLERELSAVGRKVDVLTEAAISPYLRQRILGDLQVIYADECDDIPILKAQVQGILRELGGH
jgi:predicted nucleotidyltransferase